MKAILIPNLDSIGEAFYYSCGISHRRRFQMAAIAMMYDAKMDSKKRVTLRGAKYEDYNVQELDDGRIILSPRVLVSPFELSQNTLETMDQSMENYESGKISEPVKL